MCTRFGSTVHAMIALCKKHGAVSIFDEVMTGCRLSRSGMQGRVGLVPDMTCLGKIVGGGMPLAAYGGRADVMRCVAPVGNVYQAGTLSGNPVAVSAGLAMLRHLSGHPEVYVHLENAAAKLCAAAPDGVIVNRVGSMFTFFFTDQPVTNWETAKVADTARFKAFFHHLLDHGVYLPPSQFEAGFVSAAHDDAAVNETIAAIQSFR